MLFNLPEPRFEQESVTLHKTERALYDRILTQCARDIDNAVSSRVKIKKYGTLFTAIMKLRRLCNHGIFSLSSTSNTTAFIRFTPGSGEGCEFCNGDDEDKLKLVIHAPSAGGFSP
jgi:SWI/SNF-related matrix-associated actin-dependent regulator of chromatin subfamily A3